MSVVIPWAGDCPHRTAARRWVLGRYRAVHPDWQVVLAGADADEWRKADAVAAGLAEARGDVVVVADADVWCDSAEAVRAVASGAAWAVPHRLVHRLSPESTELVLQGEAWEGLPLDPSNNRNRRPYLGVTGGGIVAARRETLLDVPMDRRFVGWGQEDEAWAFALGTLTGQRRPWRGDEDLVHLWHPPQARDSRMTGSQAGADLLRRYKRARNSPDVMRRLVDEARLDAWAARHVMAAPA